ncbi:PUSL1 protein, partial [Sitta europaea]|nr:PUSL1 protein [Sitta europaea]
PAPAMVCAPARYLVYFQYFGTRYSGVMQTKTDQALVGVQNYLEEAAQQLRPSAPIKFHISSRTDTGVHALANTAHLDIQRPPGKAAFSGQQLLQGLNRFLRPEPIRILSAQRVPSTFHARFCALSRTYIYRLLLGCAHHSQIPVFERDLCWAPAGGGICAGLLQEAFTARFLGGLFHFGGGCFLVFWNWFLARPVRTLVRLCPAPGLLQLHCPHRGLEFWEVQVTSRSFLYRQVRRMVGALVAVGQRRMAPGHIQELLELRDPRAFPAHAMAPARGLFLQRVEY